MLIKHCRLFITLLSLFFSRKAIRLDKGFPFAFCCWQKIMNWFCRAFQWIMNFVQSLGGEWAIFRNFESPILFFVSVPFGGGRISCACLLLFRRLQLIILDPRLLRKSVWKLNPVCVQGSFYIRRRWRCLRWSSTMCWCWACASAWSSRASTPWAASRPSFSTRQKILNRAALSRVSKETAIGGRFKIRRVQEEN